MLAASASPIRTTSSAARCSLRANALAKGFSGARVETVELLVECLNRGVLPVVPARGSVGASGDLAPLAHLALPLVGEGEAVVGGRAPRWRRGASPRRSRADPAREQGGPLARERHAVHGRDGRARDRARAAPGGVPPISRARSRWRRSRARGRASRPPCIERDRSRDNRRRRRTCWRLLEGSAIIESHRWCDQVQDAYALRCAPQVHGACRDLLDYVEATVVGRAQRRDGQPARAPRRGRDRVCRKLSRPAAGVRARCARDGGCGAREHLGAAHRAAREPEPLRTVSRPSS